MVPKRGESTSAKLLRGAAQRPEQLALDSPAPGYRNGYFRLQAIRANRFVANPSAPRRSL
jgi:hypothetical protein